MIYTKMTISAMKTAYNAHLGQLDYNDVPKSVQSAMLKYDRYYPDHQARKVFDDLLGFRSLCDNYEDVLALRNISELKVADMLDGKSNENCFHKTEMRGICG